MLELKKYFRGIRSCPLCCDLQILIFSLHSIKSFVLSYPRIPRAMMKKIHLRKKTLASHDIKFSKRKDLQTFPDKLIFPKREHEQTKAEDKREDTTGFGVFEEHKRGIPQGTDLKSASLCYF